MTVDKKIPCPNTLAIPAIAEFVIKIKSKTEIKEALAFAQKKNLPLIPIGAGSNIIPHSHLKAVILILDYKGIKLISNRLKIEAGENWDDVVKFAVKNNLTGIEALSWIPGRAGSAPIQNIGAYGTEISEYLESVEVYDRVKNRLVILDKKACQFEYRDSLFKKYPQKFIITALTLKLKKGKPQIPKYKEVMDYFKAKKNLKPDLKAIRRAIITIRKKKLPDPNITPNAGSYFVNPLISKSKAKILKNKFPAMPTFPMGREIKIPAGWLIEKAGLKGAQIGPIQISAQNALILTNPHRANFTAIMKTENFIIQKVHQKFGITLKREPRIIS